MGVDIRCYLVYGVNTECNEFLNGNDYYEDEERENRKIISSEDIKKYNLTFENDCFGSEWGIIGIDLFDNDAEKFAENVRTAPQKFKEFAEKYDIDLEKYEPAFDLDAYYW